MSDSDSSDSDDDLLGGGPTFAKPTRKEKANEKKMFGFLENCLAKNVERTEKKQRIDDCIREAEQQKAAALEQAELAAGGKDDSSSSPKTSTASAAGSSGTKKSFMKRSSYDIEDPDEYFRKIEEMGSRGGGADGRAKRRRQIEDIVDGLDELSSDEEGDGSPEDQRRRKALASAKATGLSTCLGTRRLFLSAEAATAAGLISGVDVTAEHDERKSVFPFNAASMSTFKSANDALSHLKSTLKSLNDTAGKRGSMEQKRLERTIKDTVIKSLKAASEDGAVALSQYLNQMHLVTKCTERSLPVPREVVDWLFIASCSGNAISSVSFGSCKTLTSIMKSQLKVIDFGEDDENSSSNKIASLQELVPGLERLFCFWTKDGPSPAMDEESSSETDGNSNGKKKPRKTFLENATGLGQFFSLWETALDYDYVALPGQHKEANVDDAKPTWNDEASQVSTTAIAILAKTMIDPIFHSGRGHLIHAQKSLVIALIEYCTRRFSDEAELSKLRLAIARALFDTCSGLSSGLPKSADEDDADGWLPLSLVIHHFPIERNYEPLSIDALRLKAIISEYVLMKCLDCEEGDWKERVDGAFKQYSKSLCDKKLSERWTMLVSAEVALRRIQSIGDEITRDGTRYLTCVEIVQTCAILGTALFSVVEPSTDGTGGIYGSIEEADAVSQILETLEALCTQLKKKITLVLAYPHLRRTKEVLMLLAVFYRHSKVRASGMAQHRGEISMKQKTLTGWFGADDSQTQTDPSGDSQDMNED